MQSWCICPSAFGHGLGFMVFASVSQEFLGLGLGLVLGITFSGLDLGLVLFWPH